MIGASGQAPTGGVGSIGRMLEERRCSRLGYSVWKSSSPRASRRAGLKTGKEGERTMKKILLSLPAFALALVLAAPVSAWWMPSNDELEVSSSNNALVTNNTTATSKTGGNTTLFNKGMMSGNISTGYAGSMAESHLTLNGNASGISAPCNCYDDVTVKSKNNAFVMNTTMATSKTGGNKTVGNGGYIFGGGSGNVTSGAAESAAGSWLVVNSNLTSLP